MLASIGLGLECWPGRHGKVTIYDGAMFHKAGRFEMILKLQSLCEPVNVWSWLQGLVYQILALLWIPGKMQQQQHKVVLAFVEWDLLIMFSNVL